MTDLGGLAVTGAGIDPGPAPRVRGDTTAGTAMHLPLGDVEQHDDGDTGQQPGECEGDDELQDIHCATGRIMNA